MNVHATSARERPCLRAAVKSVIGRPIWYGWRGYALSLFFEMGEPATRLGRGIGTRTINGVNVTRRNASVWGSHSIGIEGPWCVFSGTTPVADCECSDAICDRIVHWITGQHLVDLTRSETAIALCFD